MVRPRDDAALDSADRLRFDCRLASGRLLDLGAYEAGERALRQSTLQSQGFEPVVCHPFHGRRAEANLPTISPCFTPIENDRPVPGRGSQGFPCFDTAFFANLQCVWTSSG